MLWWLLSGALLIVFSHPKLIALAIKSWRLDIPKEREPLYKAGRWIGILERLLVFVFVLLGQYAAIGFLLAAKSIFRFGDLREAKTKAILNTYSSAPCSALAWQYSQGYFSDLFSAILLAGFSLARTEYRLG